MAARAKEGVNSAAAQTIVEDKVKNADHSQFVSLSPNSAGSLTVKVRDKTHFFKKPLFQAVKSEDATLPPGKASATTTMMSMAVSFAIFMMH